MLGVAVTPPALLDEDVELATRLATEVRLGWVSSDVTHSGYAKAL